MTSGIPSVRAAAVRVRSLCLASILIPSGAGRMSIAGMPFVPSEGMEYVTLLVLILLLEAGLLGSVNELIRIEARMQCHKCMCCNVHHCER